MARNERKKDRHKNKPLQLRLHPSLRAQLEALARRNLTTMSSEAAAALRRHLAENGLWPPPPEAKN